MYMSQTSQPVLSIENRFIFSMDIKVNKFLYYFDISIRKNEININVMKE